MSIPYSYSIHPLGDSAVLIDLGNTIDKEINHRVLSYSQTILQNRFDGLIEVVPAYSSLAVFYDASIVRKNNPPSTTSYEAVKEKIEIILSGALSANIVEGRFFEVPVCYDIKYGKDLNDIGDPLHLSTEEIIELHTSRIYNVYMIGFLPGFPYLGDVDEKLFLPRKKSPVHVSAGSVGLAGKQTGIYPMDSPGGWQIIGRTPMRIFEKEKQSPVLFRAGDQIKFYSITPDEF